MPKLKGNILTARLTVLDQLFGEQGRQKIWPHLTDGEREILDDEILSGSWYDNALLVNLMRVIESELGTGDQELTRRMGYHAAAIQLGHVYETFVRPGNPKFLLRRCPNIWKLTHDYGRIDVRLTGENQCRFRLYEIDSITVTGLVGWVQQGLEMSGCTEIRHRCIPRPGQTMPVFEMRWSWNL